MTSFKNASSDNAFERDMHRAIYSGNVEKVNSIIDSFSPSYLLPWEESKKLLTAALQCGMLEIAKILLEKACHIGDTLSPTMRLYPDAMLSGDVEQVKLLLDKDPQSLNKTLHGDTLLHLAIHLDKDSMVQLLIDRGANFNLVDSDGLFPLHVAVRRENPVILKLLLDAGASTESKTLYTGQTSLLFAMNNFLLPTNNYLINTKPVIDQRYKIVKQLVDAGADINQTNIWGQTPLHIACLFNDIYVNKIIFLLLDAGADINALDYKGMVPSYVFMEKIVSVSMYVDKIPFTMIEHLIKVREAGLYLHDKNKSVLDKFMKSYCEDVTVFVSPTSRLIKKLIENCRSYIYLMKEFKTFNGSALYDILKKLNNIPLYSATGNEVEFLKLVIFKNIFPLYTIILKTHLKYAVLRRSLLAQAQDCLVSLIDLSKIQIPLLPEEIRIYIVSYLKNCELNGLINTIAVIKSKNKVL